MTYSKRAELEGDPKINHTLLYVSAFEDTIAENEKKKNPFEDILKGKKNES